MCVLSNYYQNHVKFMSNLCDVLWQILTINSLAIFFWSFSQINGWPAPSKTKSLVISIIISCRNDQTSWRKLPNSGKSLHATDRVNISSWTKQRQQQRNQSMCYNRTVTLRHYRKISEYFKNLFKELKNYNFHKKAENSARNDYDSSMYSCSVSAIQKYN